MLRKLEDIITKLRDPGVTKEEVFEGGTERKASSCLLMEKREGAYHCAKCDNHLFNSGGKYESYSGWPSFFEPVEGALEYKEDTSHGMTRTEYHCANCGAHQGHRFNDGPKDKTGQRYCNNGIALTFKPKDK